MGKSFFWTGNSVAGLWADQPGSRGRNGFCFATAVPFRSRVSFACRSHPAVALWQSVSGAVPSAPANLHKRQAWHSLLFLLAAALRCAYGYAGPDRLSPDACFPFPIRATVHIHLGPLTMHMHNLRSFINHGTM